MDMAGMAGDDGRNVYDIVAAATKKGKPDAYKIRELPVEETIHLRSYDLNYDPDIELALDSEFRVK